MKNIYRTTICIMALLIGAVSCSTTESLEELVGKQEAAGRVTLDVNSESPLLVMNDEGSEGDINFKSRGGEVTLDVITNQESWEFTATDAEWLTIDSDKHFLHIAAERNLGEASQSATIVITATGKGGGFSTSVTLNISQNHSGIPEVSLTQNELRLKAHTELEQFIEVETNQEEWSFDCTCSWLLIEQGTEGLTLTADDNTTTAQREATITVTAGIGENTDTDTIIVRQDGTAFVILNTHNVATDDNGGVKSITVECNPELEWYYVTPDNPTWYTLSHEGNILSINITSNIGGNERKDTLLIQVGDPDNYASAEITIRQIGADTEELIYEVEVPEKEYTLTAAPILTAATGGKITVDWGDGSEPETFESKRGTHTYKDPGLYTISISGEARSLEFGIEGELSTELRNIISWGKLGYTSAVDMCLGCSRLESIPNDVAGSFSGVKSFLGAFSCCESLKEIPAGLFKYATVAKNFEDCFSHSASISEIPAGLFANCSAAEDFSYVFYGTGTGIVVTNTTLGNFTELRKQVDAGRLHSLPAGLFANCSAIKQLDYAFGATAIESIPEDLFAKSSNATIFTGAFSACTLLKSIPQQLMEKATAATDIKYMFAGCASLTDLPVGMFTNNSTITNLEYIFYKTGITTLKAGTFDGLTGVKTVGAVFQGCESLTTIEDNAFRGLTAAKSFRYCFSDCTALNSIPATLFQGMSNAYEFTYTFENTALESVPATLFNECRDYSSADFTYMFSACTNLKSVPATLFEHFTKVTSPGFRYMFEDSGLESVPAGLFAKNTNVSTGFESVFENCTSLKRIDGSIFPTTSTVSSMAYAFSNCPKLESVPADLFTPIAESKTKFTGTFLGCTSLTTLPSGLFKSNVEAAQFTGTFTGCTGLETIPADLFGECSSVNGVRMLFDGCKALKSIPAGLFANMPAITTFERTFADCTSLESLPADLFSAIGTKDTGITLSECFSGCASLKSLPTSLFDTVRRINYIDSCFKGCTSLTGESPYTVIIAGDGTESHIHLYERERGDDFPNAPVSTSAHADCFSGCTGLTDYANIPSSWR